MDGTRRLGGLHRQRLCLPMLRVGPFFRAFWAIAPLPAAWSAGGRQRREPVLACGPPHPPTPCVSSQPCHASFVAGTHTLASRWLSRMAEGQGALHGCVWASQLGGSVAAAARGLAHCTAALSAPGIPRSASGRFIRCTLPLSRPVAFLQPFAFAANTVALRHKQRVRIFLSPLRHMYTSLHVCCFLSTVSLFWLFSHRPRRQLERRMTAQLLLHYQSGWQVQLGTALGVCVHVCCSMGNSISEHAKSMNCLASRSSRCVLLRLLWAAPATVYRTRRRKLLHQFIGKLA